MSNADGRKPSILRQAIQALSLAALGLASYLLISHFFLQSVRVVGVSMAPTLHDSERYLLNRWIYYFRAPHQADIVVIRDPVDQGFSVKRIIGVAGDSVDLKDGAVYVNGRKLSEPYLEAGIQTYTYSRPKERPYRCGRDEYFLLGDNRLNSADSRVYGPVSRQNIVGMIVQ